MARASKSITYYPWYADDWLQSESRMRMTLAERGAYRDLLDYCYREGSIPDDPDMLCKLLLCSREELDQVWPAVRKHFVKAKRGRLVNKKARLVRDRVRNLSDRLRAAGKRSAEKRSGKKAERAQTGSSDPQQNQPDAQPMLNTGSSQAAANAREHVEARLQQYKNKIKNKTYPSLPSPEHTLRHERQDHAEIFELIYARHQRKDGRILAEQAWAQRLSELPNDRITEEAQRIDERHRRWCEYQIAQGTEPRFWPALNRWLLDRRDLDDIPAADDPMAVTYDESRE